MTARRLMVGRQEIPIRSGEYRRPSFIFHSVVYPSFTMSLSIGIVGLPNVGKSTLFKSLTKKSVLIANYPFATVDPNVGVVEVPDERLDALSHVSKSEKTIAAVVNFTDIAGLVKGASKGEGLGNQFLSHIRETDAIAMVVRGFSDPNVIHVSGKVDPKNDVEVVTYELIFADLETVERRLGALKAKAKAGLTSELTKEIGVVERVHGFLRDGKPARGITLTDEEEPYASALNLLTSKPVLYILNVDEQVMRDKSWEGLLPAEYQPQIPISAKIESELADLPPEDAATMLKEFGLDHSGLDELIRRGYETLDLITFFTSGPKETRAWTVHRGATAPEAAGKIHTDFEKGFIRAEVIHWKDFVEANGEAGAKERGALRIEGKEYVMADGDVCHFRFNV